MSTKTKIASAATAVLAAATVATILPAGPAQAAYSNGCSRAEYASISKGMPKDRVTNIVDERARVQFQFAGVQSVKYGNAWDEPWCYVDFERNNRGAWVVQSRDGWIA